MKEWVEKLRLGLWNRQGAYRDTFRAPTAQLVLKDLARFCRAHEPAFHPDARKHALAEGRREVWLRIQEHLNLNSEELWTLYSGRGRPDAE
jgi:hypothetical protein